MKDWSKVTIRTADEPSTAGTIVEIDGIPMKGIIEVGFTHVIGRMPVVTLTMYATLELEGVARLLEQKIKP